MSRVRADRLTNRAGTGAPTFPNGVNVVGLVSATTLSGNLTGNVTGNASGTAGGLTGTPNIVVGSVTGTTGTFSGSVSVGGTITYEDVTNVDSVGIITARSGVDLNGTLREKVNVTAGKLSDNLNIDLANGMIHLFTTAESTTAVPNIRVNGSTSLNNVMAIGESAVVTLVTTANAAAYSANITIDGGAVTEHWIGGSAPSAGGSSGFDVHTFTIIKRANADFTVIANHSKTS